MEKFAVIVAGGSGSRMGHATPKQFLEVGGKSLLMHTIDAFLRAFEDMQIIVVLPEVHMNMGRNLIEANYPDSNRISTTVGGSTRYASVQNGINLATDSSIIFVHDAVRCMVSSDLIIRCYETALVRGSAIPVISVKDSIRMITPNGSEVVNREVLRAVQTPQTFKAEILKKAFTLPYQDAFTDEATVVEYGGGKVELIQGEETNIKVTYPADLLMAEQFFKSGRSSF